MLPKPQDENGEQRRPRRNNGDLDDSDLWEDEQAVIWENAVIWYRGEDADAEEVRVRPDDALARCQTDGA